jgi:hypothetical protein
MSFFPGHALLIGVGSYRNHPEFDVPTAVTDAQELAGVFRDARYCGYPESQTRVLCDSGATREGILAALDKLAARAGEQDTALLFYCGHGIYGEDGQYYLTSHDSRFANRKVVSGAGVSQRELLERLGAIRAKRMLLIFNACHSGAVTPTLGAEQPVGGLNPSETLSGALLATGEGRVIIAACRASQVSYIGAVLLTIFTQALADGLRGAGVNDHAGYISAFDLYSFVYATVRDRVRDSYRAIQEPELTILKGVGPFAIALYPGATTPGEFSAGPITGPAVREVTPDASQALLQQIQHGGIDFGQAHSVVAQGSIVGGNQSIEVGGDYTTASAIDQRQGITISGGTVSGVVVGFNQGTIAIAGGTPRDPLLELFGRIEQAASRAQQRGDENLALDLQSVALLLRAAFKAQQDANDERRQDKLRAASVALHDLTAERPDLGEAARALDILR